MTHWEIIETSEYKKWFAGLLQVQRDDINSRVERLRDEGPALTRPYADHVKGSTFTNLKELRISTKGKIRILFIFDPQRRAVLLIGGDKSTDSEWNKWYQRMIPLAEIYYRNFLEQQREKE